MSDKNASTVKKPAPKPAPEAAVAAKPAFAIATVALPAAKRAAKAALYPFDSLQVGQSFFVPNSDSQPNAAKSLASTVASATARYSRVIEGQTKKNRKGKEVPATEIVRKFVVRAVEDGKDWGAEHAGVAGAGVFRVK